MLLARRVVAVVAVLLALTAPSAMAQVDLGQQVEVDRIMRALADNLPSRGVTIFTEIAPSDVFYVAAAENRVHVTTRFLREASRDALAAWVTLDLLPDPVFAAITLHRAGFDGARGLAELQQRQATLHAWRAHYERSANLARAGYRVTADWYIHRAVVLDGYRLMVQREIDQAYASHLQTVWAHNRYVAELPRAYAMPTVPSELITVLAEITAVLRGERSFEGSPWGERIKDVLALYDGPKAQ